MQLDGSSLESHCIRIIYKCCVYVIDLSEKNKAIEYVLKVVYPIIPKYWIEREYWMNL